MPGAPTAPIVVRPKAPVKFGWQPYVPPEYGGTPPPPPVVPDEPTPSPGSYAALGAPTRAVAPGLGRNIRDAYLLAQEQASGLIGSGLSLAGAPDADPFTAEKLNDPTVPMYDSIFGGAIRGMNAGLSAATERDTEAGLSPQRKAQRQRFSAEKAALADALNSEGKTGFLDRIGPEAALSFKQAKEDPLAVAAAGAGAVAPFMLAGPAMAAMELSPAAAAILTGTLAGGGAVKQGIYQTVAQTPFEDLMGDPVFASESKTLGPEAARERMASRLQSYRENPAAIAAGFGEGAVMGMLGPEEQLFRTVGGMGMKDALIKDLTKKAAGGVIRGAVTTGLKEAGSEAVQEGLEQYLGNVGAAKTGAKIDPMSGVADAAVQAGLMSVGGGAYAGGRESIDARRELAHLKASDPSLTSNTIPDGKPTDDINELLGKTAPTDPSTGTHEVPVALPPAPALPPIVPPSGSDENLAARIEAQKNLEDQALGPVVAAQEEAKKQAMLEAQPNIDAVTMGPALEELQRGADARQQIVERGGPVGAVKPLPTLQDGLARLQEMLGEPDGRVKVITELRNQGMSTTQARKTAAALAEQANRGAGQLNPAPEAGSLQPGNQLGGQVAGPQSEGVGVVRPQVQVQPVVTEALSPAPRVAPVLGAEQNAPAVQALPATDRATQSRGNKVPTAVEQASGQRSADTGKAGEVQGVSPAESVPQAPMEFSRPPQRSPEHPNITVDNREFRVTPSPDGNFALEGANGATYAAIRRGDQVQLHNVSEDGKVQPYTGRSPIPGAEFKVEDGQLKVSRNPAGRAEGERRTTAPERKATPENLAAHQMGRSADAIQLAKDTIHLGKKAAFDAVKDANPTMPTKAISDAVDYAARQMAKPEKPTFQRGPSRTEEVRQSAYETKPGEKRVIEGAEAEKLRSMGFRVDDKGINKGTIPGAPPFVQGIKDVQKQIARAVSDVMSPRAHAFDAVWYARAGAALRKFAHGDKVLLEKLVRIVAKLSQAAGVDSNITFLNKGIFQMAKGEIPSTGRYPNKFKEQIGPMLEAKVFDTNLLGVGSKLVKFYRNLHDEAFQENRYPNDAVIDSHAIAYIWDDPAKSSVKSDMEYDYAQRVIQLAAEEYNRRTGKKLKARDIQSVLWGIWKREGAPSAVEGDESAAWNYPEYLERGSHKVTVEAVPSSDTELGKKLEQLSPEDKKAFTKEAFAVILDEDGQNELARRAGLLLHYDVEGSGGFEGSINPNQIFTLFAKRAPSEGGFQRYDYDQVDRFTRAWQYISQQKGAPWFRADPMIDPAQLDALRETQAKRIAKGQPVGAASPQASLGFFFEFDKKLTPAAEAKFFAALVSEIPDAGYTRVDDHRIAVINYRDKATNVPFGLSDLDFDAAIRRVAGTVKPREVVHYGAETEYHTHDFGADPSGSEILRQETDRGGPEWAAYLRDRRDAFEAVARKWASKVGGERLSVPESSRGAAAQVEQLAASRKAPETPSFSRKASEQQKPAGFYSALERAAAQMKQPMKGSDALLFLSRKEGVKKAEIEATKLGQFLEGKQRVTPAEVQEYLKSAAVKVETKTLGTKIHKPDQEVYFWRQGKAAVEINDPESVENPQSAYREDVEKGLAKWVDENGKDLTVDEAIKRAKATAAYWNQAETSPKFAQYQTPGGTNYREELLTLPAKDPSTAFGLFRKRMEEKYGPNYPANMTPSESERMDELRSQTDGGDRNNFRSSHFDEPNIVVHVRMNDRMVNGKKVLFVEEIQSDWAQKGRREGFRGEESRRLSEIDADMDRYNAELERGDITELEYHRYLNAAQQERNRLTGSVPSAPFVEKTEDWTALAMKQILQKAAAEGYDSVAWTTGDMQAERYDLSKQVDRIGWRRLPNDTYDITVSVKDGNPIIRDHLKPAELADVIGKEVTDKILADKGERSPDGIGLVGHVDGEGLKVGHEKMSAFYDKIVPQVAEKIAKKWGAKVSTMEIETKQPKGNPQGPFKIAGRDGFFTVYDRFRNSMGGAPTREAAQEIVDRLEAKDKPQPKTVHSITLTDAMKQDIKNEGFPLFNRNASPMTEKAWEHYGSTLGVHDTTRGVAYDKAISEDKQVKGAPRGVIVADFEKDVPQSVVDWMQTAPSQSSLANRLVSAVRQISRVAGYTVNFGGFTPAGNLHGVFYKGKVYVNNLATHQFALADAKEKGITYARAAAERMAKLLLHEYAHGKISGHGMDFEAEVARLRAAIGDSAYAAIVSDLEKSFARENQTEMEKQTEQAVPGWIAGENNGRQEAARVEREGSERSRTASDRDGGSSTQSRKGEDRTGVPEGTLRDRSAEGVQQPGKPEAKRLAGSPELRNGDERLAPGDPRRDENFRKWFGDSKVVDENGKPLVVYHGTTHEISAFRPSKTNPENDFGKGIYTTNSPQDASENYAGVGQDLMSRIERLAERIVQEKDWEYDDPRAKKLAEKRLHGGAESVLPLYLKVENPVVIGEGQNEPTMMNDRQIRKFVLSIDKSVTQARSNPEIGEALEALLTAEDYGEYNAERLIKFAREASIYEEDSKGNLVSSDIVRRALQAAGFDGVIDQTVNKKWGDESKREAPMRGMNADTIHYIAFGPEQAKSATGNRGTFDPKNPDIRYSRPASRSLEDIAPPEEKSKSEPVINVLKSRPLRQTPMSTEDIASRVAAASAGTGTPDGTPLSELAPPEFHRNMKVVLDALPKAEAERFARIYDVFDKEMDTAKGKLTWEQGDKEALKLLGIYSREQVLKLAQRGVVFNEPGLRAATRLMYEVEAENREALKKLNEAKAAGGGGVDSEEFRDYTASSVELASWMLALRGEQAEAARAFAARRDLKGARTPQEKLLNKLFKDLGGITEAQAAQIVAKAQQDPTHLPDVIRAAFKPTFWSYIHEWRKGSMLWSPRTYGVNFFGNALKQASTLAEIPAAAMADALRSKLTGSQRQVYMGEIGAARAALADYMPMAFKQFIESSKKALRGEEVFDENSSRPFEHQVGVIPGPLGKIIRTPFRMLTAADEFYKQIGRAQALYREAYRRARQKGLDGQKAMDFVDELMQVGKDSQWQDKRVAGMHERADKIAQYETFTLRPSYENSGVFGAIAQYVMQLEKKIPSIGLFLPFKGTPANIAYQGFERSPFGWVAVRNRALELRDLSKQLETATPGQKADIQEQLNEKGKEFAEQVSRATMGTALFIFGAGLAAAGMLTGSGPPDPDKRRQWMNAGNIPTGLKIGDQWYAYDRFEPLAASIAAAASIPAIYDARTPQEKIGGMMNAVHDMFVAKTYLQGLEQLGDIVTDPLRYGVKWLRDLESSFVPAAVGQTADMLDPVVRDNKGTLIDPIRARIPGLTEGLRAIDTGTGEPAKRTERLGGIGPLNPLGFIRTGSAVGDPLAKEFVAADYAPDAHKTYVQVGVGPVGRKKIEKIDLTKQELDVFRRADEAVTEKLKKVIQTEGWKTLDPDQKKAVFFRAYGQASDQAKEAVMPYAVARLRERLQKEKK